MADFDAQGRLVQSGRLDFAPDLRAAMPVPAGQHRAHVISYDEITRSVIDPLNRFRQTGVDWRAPVASLIRSVYPNRSTQRRHIGPNAASLAAVAARHYGSAMMAYYAIGQLVRSGQWMGLRPWVNLLIGALNSSPDNLRPGSSSTNSSIQEGLDPQPRSVQPVEVLPAGTTRVNTSTMRGRRYSPVALTHNTTVLRISPLDEQMIWTLLTTTWTESNAVHLYSSGLMLQSSDYAGMTSGNMTNANPTHLAIQVPGTQHFFLFDI